jgi:ADP-ribose pyrophosphatase YjhB (NUDIX family)
MPVNPPVQFELSAGGVVIDGEQRALLIRTRNMKEEEVWTLPKGRLDAGETSEDAAVREVREETGWRCEVVRALAPVTYWFQRGRGDTLVRVKKTVHWYLMPPTGPLCMRRAENARFQDRRLP